MPPATHPLQIADYRIFWLARFASQIAQTGMVVILGYQLYDTARQDYHLSIEAASFRLGLLGLAQFLPLALLTPVAGVIADRHDRRRVAALAMGIDTGVALALALATQRHALSIPLLFALAAAHGMARVFVSPSLGAIAPNIVPGEILPQAVALNSIAWQGGTIFGPAVAGALFAASPALPYWISVGTLLVTIVGVLSIRRLPPGTGMRGSHPLRQIAEGFAFVRRERFLLGCITLDLFAVLLGGATALLPAYARDILHVGPQGLGQMRAAPAIGAALVGLLLSLRPLSRRVGWAMLLSVAAYGVATIVFGVSRFYPLTLAALALLGAADSVSVFVRTALVQINTPDDKRGRVSAISGLAISASNELGDMQSGVAAALLGVTGAVVLGGVGAIAITGLWAWLFPELPEADRFAPQATSEGADP